jgi:O-antigen/teichoic acid export membrane protein
MNPGVDVPGSASPEAESTADSRWATEGVVSGLLGAAVISLWFLILDTLNGRPLYTPTVLGTAVFRRGAGLENPELLPVSGEMVLMFTWVHVLMFIVIGGLASRLVGLAEKSANYGFGIVLLVVIFGFGFIAAALMFAEQVLHALTIPAILIGNLLATAAMAGYFWRHHRGLRILP